MNDTTLPDAIARVANDHNLTHQQMTAVMRHIMNGNATDAQIGGFLIGLRMKGTGEHKGETVTEITAAAQVMRDFATHVSVDVPRLIDTCGTGGSNVPTFNISTTAAFVAAAAGARVAKHGNRRASGKSGSADVLEAADIRLDLDARQVAHCINEVGIGFLFAQNHHGAMKHAIGPRREIGTRTIFNLLGPLTNPASAKRQIIGVFHPRWLRPLAEVAQALGSEHVMVVHGTNDANGGPPSGIDEISVSGPTKIAELKNGEITEYQIHPDDFGIRRAPLTTLLIDTPEQSLALMQSVLQNKSSADSAAADIVALNAGAAIYIAGCCDTLGQGIEMARDAIGSGLAAEKFEQLVTFTRHLPTDNES